MCVLLADNLPIWGETNVRWSLDFVEQSFLSGQCIGGRSARLQVGVFQTLFLGATPKEAWQRLAAGAPYCSFRDASTGDAMMPLTVLDIIEASFRVTNNYLSQTPSLKIFGQRSLLSS